VTGVQTCALPIYPVDCGGPDAPSSRSPSAVVFCSRVINATITIAADVVVENRRESETISGRCMCVPFSTDTRREACRGGAHRLIRRRSLAAIQQARSCGAIAAASSSSARGRRSPITFSPTTTTEEDELRHTR